MGEHADLFGRAALVARDLTGSRQSSRLRNKSAMRSHTRGITNGTALSCSGTQYLCAIGAATQGWDQTGSNGANLSFPKEFGLPGKGTDEWIVGIINAIIFLTVGLM
jgi:hypothetical protein